MPDKQFINSSYTILVNRSHTCTDQFGKKIASSPLCECHTKINWFKLFHLTCVTSGSNVFSTDLVRICRFFGSHRICRDPVGLRGWLWEYIFSTKGWGPPTVQSSWCLVKWFCCCFVILPLTFGLYWSSSQRNEHLKSKEMGWKISRKPWWVRRSK